MKAVIALCILFVGAYCAPMLDDQLDNAWSLFKRVHERQYNSVEEESTRYVMRFFPKTWKYYFDFIYSRNIWEANLAKIRQHNLEADNGVHTYTLGMNRFGDLVGFYLYYNASKYTIIVSIDS